MSSESISLSTRFLNRYPDFPAHMDKLGKFTYLRTYSRYLPKLKRREVFRETMNRAAEYSLGLEYAYRMKKGLPIPKKRMKKELKQLFDNMFNLRQGLSGRTTWVGGADTKVADKFPLANFNCSFTITETWKDLAELFYLLLVGTGVGFKTIKKMCEKLPAIRNNFELEHVPYAPNPRGRRSDDTYVDYDGNTVTIKVGDSKEAWVEALLQFLMMLSSPDHENITKIRIFYNWVRPRGERLLTFGGTASGPEPLQEMFDGFRKVLLNEIDPFLEPLEVVDSEKGYVRVRPIHIVDMCNLIGYNVVVGGVRRTAEIALGEEDDWEFIFAKYGINGIWGDEGFAHHEYLRNRMITLGIPVPKFWDTLAVKWYKVIDPETEKVLLKTESIDEAIAFANEHKIENYFPFPCNEKRGLHHRRMSNNSIGFLRKPEQEFLDFLFEVMQKEGEPGFVNLYELSVRRLKRMGVENPSKEQILDLAYYLGVNPCGEIDLYSKGVCNLTTVNVRAFVINGVLDKKGLLAAQRLSARAGLRMTLVTLELPNWDEVQQRDRLLGCSLTGWKAAMAELDYTQEQEDLLKVELRVAVHEESIAYSEELGVNRPLLETTVKPEGTYTLVMGAGSSGLHYPKIRRGIRRIRINSEDPLAKAVLEHKTWVINPEVGTKGNTFEERMASARTLVVDFPMKSDCKLTEIDVNVYQQFENYFSFQDRYTDHNSSNTIVVEPNEWLVCSKIVYENWDNFVGVSFLAKDGGNYELAPYENNDERYEELVAEMTDLDMNILAKYEKDEDSELYDSDCKDGNCAIR